MLRLSDQAKAALVALPSLLAETGPARHWQIAQDYQLSQRLLRQAFAKLSKAGTAPLLDLYRPGVDLFAVTLTCDTKEMQDYFEPRAGCWYDRILALKEAKRHGIGTWASIEPVVNPASSLKLIALAAPVCGHFKIGALNRTQDNPELARLAAGIGWRDFGRRAIELCESAGRTYFIKDDLAKYLDGVKYTNTDTRILQRKDGGS